MSEQTSPLPSSSTIEEILRALTGVISAHVEVGAFGRPTKVHILCSADIHPKQVVRNVESALRAGLDLEIDRRIVSVAQLRPGAMPDAVEGAEYDEGESASAESAEKPRPGSPEVIDSSHAPPPAALASAGEGRLIYIDHEVTLAADRTARCAVSFRLGSEEYVGRGEGPDTVTGRAEAAARAVFSVFDECRFEDRLALEGIAVVDLPERRCVIASVRPLGRRPAPLLTGAAILTDSPEEAAIMAVLQATNSWRSSG